MQEDKYYNRKYEACAKLILDEKPFDKNLRRILAEVYPDEVVQTLYDVIIYEALKEGMTAYCWGLSFCIQNKVIL